FRAPVRPLARALFGLTAVLLVWTFLIRHYPQPGQHRSSAFESFLIVFIVHWTILTVASGWSLWRAGRAQPSVARRRMQFLAFASVAIALALILAGPNSSTNSGYALSTNILALFAAMAFLVGFSPPQVVRILWRAPETERFQQAMTSLLTFAE